MYLIQHIEEKLAWLQVQKPNASDNANGKSEISLKVALCFFETIQNLSQRFILWDYIDLYTGGILKSEFIRLKVKTVIHGGKL